MIIDKTTLLCKNGQAYFEVSTLENTVRFLEN